MNLRQLKRTLQYEIETLKDRLIHLADEPQSIGRAQCRGEIAAYEQVLRWLRN